MRGWAHVSFLFPPVLCLVICRLRARLISWKRPQSLQCCFPQCMCKRCAFRKLRSRLALSPICSMLESLCACANCSSIMRRRRWRGPGRGPDLLHHALDGLARARFKLGSAVACRQANVLLAFPQCWRPILQPTWLTR